VVLAQGPQARRQAPQQQLLGLRVAPRALVHRCGRRADGGGGCDVRERGRRAR
jgi:hypothetical protein